jgi:PAS domain S-box-containing protein
MLGNQEKLRAITKELEKSKNRFALAVDGTKAGIYEWNIDTNHIYVSARYKNLLGIDSKEEIFMNIDVFSSMIHPEDKKRSLALIKEYVRSGGAYQNEFRLKSKNGKYRWFLDSGIVSKKKGAQKLAVGSIIDIHDRKMAEQQLRNKNKELEKTNEELDRFVYSASHDMRAPLSTLLGLLNLAKLSNNLSELDEYHDLMTNRINTMEGFIQEVTDYSRNSRLEIAPSKFKARTMVKEVIKSFEFLANEARITFKIDIKANLVINSDKSRLKVILNNLVSNAIKYYDNNKKKHFVKVQVSCDAGFCIIRVVDNGIGISPDYQQKIFDMFFRASEKSDGSGLGLYIVRETLHRIKGSITCISEQNIGSTFEVRIPSI